LSLDSSTHLHINNTDNKTNTENNTIFINLCCARVSQTDSFILFANLSALFLHPISSAHLTFYVRVPTHCFIFKYRSH